MGYQESFIIVNPADVEENNKGIERLLELFKLHDVRTHDDDQGSCVARVRFLSEVREVVIEGESLFKEGMDVLWVTGERSCQRHPGSLFNYDSMDELYDTDKLAFQDIDLISNLTIIFVEDIREIMVKIDDEQFTHTVALKLEAARPAMMKAAEEFMSSIQPEQIEQNFSGHIFANDSFEQLHERIIDGGEQYRFPVEVKKSVLEHLKVPHYDYYINDHCFASYHETPHLDKKGSWCVYGSAQSMRDLARALSTSA